MRYLITGGKGLLGLEFIRQLKNAEVLSLDLPETDVCDLAALMERTVLFRPDVILHCAAWTDVDGCEDDPAKAYHVNSIGTRNVCLAAKEVGASLVYFSTDYVFDGVKNSPYQEYDPPAPLSVYGQTKLAGERIAAELCPKRYVIRTSWLFGLFGRNFVDAILRQAEEGKTISVVADQIGSPTYAKDLVQAVLALLRLSYSAYGTYHFSNSGACSWYDLAVAVIKKAGRRGKVIPVTTEAMRRPAPRPAYSVLSHELLQSLGIVPRPWQEALIDYLEELGFPQDRH